MTGTTRTHRHPSPTGGLAHARRIVGALIAKLAAGLSRQALNRRVLTKLAVMSDRELKDIGLVRQDIDDAAAVTGNGDASLLLLARRDERRGRRGPSIAAC